jgi:hypothetical protein
MMQNAYGNLTEAYLLSGRVDQALASRDRALTWVKRERSWLARVQFSAEDCCHQMVLGRMTRALELAGDVERIVDGRDRAVPPTSSFETLKTLRLRQSQGESAALAFAESVTDKYRNRVPLAYLAALVTEHHVRGKPAIRGSELQETESMLKLVPGRRALYHAMGLLDGL